METLRRRCAAVGAGIAVALIAACGGQPAESPSAGTETGGTTVVAATTWEAAYAKAAGAKNVRVIVPPSVHHAPDYDPKPSDLAAVADADVVLYAPFEGFVSKLKDATGGDARLVKLDLNNSPDNVRTEVSRLAGMLGTKAKAQAWLDEFDKTIHHVSGQLREAWPDGEPPRVVAQTYVSYMAELAGADVVGSFGPHEVTPAQLAELSGKHPDLVLDNAHMSTGPVLPDSGAEQVALVNFPHHGLDLLHVYHANAQRVIEALRG